jgi:hypothetical protein
MAQTSLSRLNQLIRASPPEIAEFRNRMALSQSYLEYGAGGTTLLACEMHVARIVSIETSLSFRTEIIDKYGLQPFMDSGRLAIHHANLGATGEWGFPLRAPQRSQVEEYLAWPARIADFDLALIDGRYRIAAAASLYLAAKDGATIMIHDYANRPAYHVIEAFLDRIKAVDTLAIFAPRPEAEHEAKRILNEYLHVGS